MDYQVRYSGTSLSDLDDLMEWSWKNFPETSEEFGAELMARVHQLARNPRVGRIVNGSIRKVLFRSISIYYWVNEQQGAIEITSFRHGRRRP